MLARSVQQWHVQCITRLNPSSRFRRTFVSSTRKQDALAGSVSPHTRHLVLFTGRHFETFPSHLEAVSPLYRAIVARLKDPKSPLNTYAVAVTDSSHELTKQSEDTWKAETGRFAVPNPSDIEEYGAVIYPDRRSVPFGINEQAVSSGLLDDFCQSLAPRSIDGSTFSDASEADPLSLENSRRNLDIFVCTHGARDCRCGDVGTSFYKALAQEATRRRIGNEAKAFNAGHGPVRIHRTTHIGGHRFAGTCFTSEGDWYGLLSPTSASVMLEKLSASKNVWWEKWRGRSGLSQAAQVALAETELLKPGSGSALDLVAQLRNKGRIRDKPLGNPITIPFVTFDGTSKPARGYIGETLMEVAKRHEMVEATCGGACECATCMVHLRSPPGTPLLIPSASDEEDDQLECALFTDNDSRLACQIELTEDLSKWFRKGGRVQLPRYT